MRAMFPLNKRKSSSDRCAADTLPTMDRVMHTDAQSVIRSRLPVITLDYGGRHRLRIASAAPSASGEFGPNDLGIDRAETREGGEAAIRARDDAFAADEVGELLDTLCDDFRVFDKSTRSGDVTVNACAVQGALRALEAVAAKWKHSLSS